MSINKLWKKNNYKFALGIREQENNKQGFYMPYLKTQINLFLGKTKKFYAL